VRDALLAASGGLERRVGGGHPFPSPTAWGYTQHGPFTAVYGHERRSVYLMTQRLQRHPFLALFDGPDPNASTPLRSESIVPTQALFFLNDPLVHQSAQRWSDGLLQALAGDRECVTRGWQQALQRDPDAEEVAEAMAFLEAWRGQLPAGTEAAVARSQAFAALLRTLLGSNEFLHVE